MGGRKGESVVGWVEEAVEFNGNSSVLHKGGHTVCPQVLWLQGKPKPAFSNTHSHPCNENVLPSSGAGS